MVALCLRDLEVDLLEHEAALLEQAHEHESFEEEMTLALAANAPYES